MTLGEVAAARRRKLVELRADAAAAKLDGERISAAQAIVDETQSERKRQLDQQVDKEMKKADCACRHSMHPITLRFYEEQIERSYCEDAFRSSYPGTVLCIPVLAMM